MEVNRTKILVVEDDSDLLFNLQMILEFNEFQPILATDGTKALEILRDFSPEIKLIISDISMPNMSGYELYRQIARHSEWKNIPFFFISAKAELEDIQFAKLLGVQDYIVKPFKEDLLLEKITHMLKTHSENEKICDEFQGRLNELIKNPDHCLIKPDNTDTPPEDSVLLLQVMWDDKKGPYLAALYPDNSKLLSNVKIQEIGEQLYMVSVGVYGSHSAINPTGVLLKIENIAMEGYIFFNELQDLTKRAGHILFMVGVIAPIIHYFASNRIHDLLKDLTEKIRSNQHYNIQKYWEEIVDVLK